MFKARIEGVWPKDVKDISAIPEVEKPIESRQFPSEADARAWLLGDGLHEFKYPVYMVDIHDAAGNQTWCAYHSSNDVLKNKNEVWWHKADPGRTERFKEQEERRRAVAEGRVPRNQLSLKEQFEVDNPLWLGPYFAWLPTSTMDAGTIWLRTYWVRSTMGIKCVDKGLFPDHY